MRYKNDRATYCHTSRIPVRRPCCQRVHLCPRRFLCWRYETEVRSSLEHFSRSSFSPRLYRRAPPFDGIPPESASLSVKILRAPFFRELVLVSVWMSALELVSGLPSPLAWDSQ